MDIKIYIFITHAKKDKKKKKILFLTYCFYMTIKNFLSKCFEHFTTPFRCFKNTKNVGVQTLLHKGDHIELKINFDFSETV